MSKSIYKKNLNVVEGFLTEDEVNNLFIEMYERAKQRGTMAKKSAVVGKAVTVKLTKSNYR